MKMLFWWCIICLIVISVFELKCWTNWSARLPNSILIRLILYQFAVICVVFKLNGFCNCDMLQISLWHCIMKYYKLIAALLFYCVNFGVVPIVIWFTSLHGF
jgi:hypothetical protein